MSGIVDEQILEDRGSPVQLPTAVHPWYRWREFTELLIANLEGHQDIKDGITAAGDLSLESSSSVADATASYTKLADLLFKTHPKFIDLFESFPETNAEFGDVIQKRVQRLVLRADIRVRGAFSINPSSLWRSRLDSWRSPSPKVQIWGMPLTICTTRKLSRLQGTQISSASGVRASKSLATDV